jgi:hypothetical protein
MNDYNNNPFVSWRLQHPVKTLNAETEIRIQQWVQVNHKLLELFDQFDDIIEPWLKGNSSIEPDLVAFIAGYGYSRTVTGDWKDLPIDIPESELTNWEENSGLFVTIEQLRDYEAGVAGSIPEILHTHANEVMGLIKKQLEDAYRQLELLVSKPTTDFSPTQWSDEDADDESAEWEVEDLDKIFDLYEKLWCFEQGIEEIRMFMITEDNPEFHLPNRGFYEVLKSIDSHTLLSNLAKAEPKMREILKLWSGTIMQYSGKPYHRPYDEIAPEIFWWRHKKEIKTPNRPQNRPQSRPQNNRRSNQKRRPTQ